MIGAHGLRGLVSVLAAAFLGAAVPACGADSQSDRVMVGSADGDSAMPGGSSATVAPDGERDSTMACISSYPAAAPVAPRIDAVVVECVSDGGEDCRSRLISMDAARCIAEMSGLEGGLRPWEIGLVYNYDFRSITWGIRNVLMDREPEGASGRAMAVDAVDGSVLGVFEWRAIVD